MLPQIAYRTAGAKPIEGLFNFGSDSRKPKYDSSDDEMPSNDGSGNLLGRRTEGPQFFGSDSKRPKFEGCGCYEQEESKIDVETSNVNEVTEVNIDEKVLSDDSAYDDSSDCGSSDCDHNYDEDVSDCEDFENEKERKRYYRYAKQLHKSESFFIDSRLIPRGYLGITYPVNLDILSDQDDPLARAVNRATEFAVEEYNKTQDKKLKLDRIIYVTACGFVYCITFLGKVDPFEGPPSTYQAKVRYSKFGNHPERKTFYFVRPEPSKVGLLKRLQRCGEFLNI